MTKRRHRRTRRGFRGARHAVFPLTVLAVILTAEAFVAYRVSAHLAPGRARPSATFHRQAPQVQVRPAVQRERAAAVYPFSVIPGGAYSAQELDGALVADKVAATHYAGFQRPLVRAVSSPFTAPVFVSYRKGDSVYWTRRPLTLRSGETLLTDGTNYARARCGNRISPTAQQPVSLEEPAEAILNTPEIPEVGAPGEAILWQEPQLVAELFPPGFPVTPDRLTASMPAVLGAAAEPMNGLYGHTSLPADPLSTRSTAYEPPVITGPAVPKPANANLNPLPPFRLVPPNYGYLVADPAGLPIPPVPPSASGAPWNGGHAGVIPPEPWMFVYPWFRLVPVGPAAGPPTDPGDPGWKPPDDPSNPAPCCRSFTPLGPEAEPDERTPEPGTVLLTGAALLATALWALYRRVSSRNHGVEAADSL